MGLPWEQDEYFRMAVEDRLVGDKLQLQWRDGKVILVETVRSCC